MADYPVPLEKKEDEQPNLQDIMQVLQGIVGRIDNTDVVVRRMEKKSEESDVVVRRMEKKFEDTKNELTQISHVLSDLAARTYVLEEEVKEAKEERTRGSRPKQFEKANQAEEKGDELDEFFHCKDSDDSFGNSKKGK